MRRFIFIVMILLLPLRGWMGEAMATEMAATNIVAVQAINTPAIDDFINGESMSDCDMHKTTKPDSSSAKSTCTHCQACHATGLVSTVEATRFDSVQYAQPRAQLNQFVSASIAHSQKPPIL